MSASNAIERNLGDVNADQLVLELLDRDLSELSDELKTILLFQVGSSLKESLQSESRSFTGSSKTLTSFEKVDPEAFICSDERILPVIKFIEAITGNELDKRIWSK